MNEEYLGDGVYIDQSKDMFGFQRLEMTTRNGHTTTNRICLGPEVIEKLLAYLKKASEL